MHCFIYKSSKKPECYLYLAARDAFADLPAGLQGVFGTPVFVMELELTPERRLAREDSRIVLDALESRGYFVQLPPQQETILQ